MRFQFLLLGLVALISFAIGGVRMRARHHAASDFLRAEREGRWRLAFAQGDRLALWSKGNGTEQAPPAWARARVNQSFAITADLTRIASVDDQGYDGPKLQLMAASRPHDPITVASGASGGQIHCPLFDANGSLLYLETISATAGHSGYTRATSTLRRLDLPADDALLGVAGEKGTAVDLPSSIVSDDCMELSADALRIAWLGTDYHVHVGRRDVAAGIVDHQSYPGTDFQLAPDGSWLMVNDGGKLFRIELDSGSRRRFAADAKIARIGAVSPDSQWVLTQELGGYKQTFTARRISDGAPVPFPFHYGQPYTYGYDVGRRNWIAWTPDELSDPPPTPPRGARRQ